EANKKILYHFDQLLEKTLKYTEDINSLANDYNKYDDYKNDIDYFISQIIQSRGKFLKIDKHTYEISHVLYPLMSKFEKHYERNEEIQNVLKQILCKPLIKPRQSHCEFENLCSLCKDKCYNNGLYCLTKCSDCDIYRDKRDKMEIKNNKKTLENNINLKRILKENEKNPYVSTQDRYFEVTITSNDNDLEKLKKTF